jgi:flagellar hook-length control protein FliK
MLIGSSQAAASGAAAAFPFLGASNTPQEPNAADAFGNLLAATIGTGEQTSDVKAAASDPLPGPTSVADAWFHTLTIDFADLNVALDNEEMGTGSALDAKDADEIADSDDADDDASWMTFGIPVLSASPIELAAQAITVPAIAPEAIAPQETAPQGDSGQATALPASGSVAEASLAPQSRVAQALLGLRNADANATNTHSEGGAPQASASQAASPLGQAFSALRNTDGKVSSADPQGFAPQAAESQAPESQTRTPQVVSSKVIEALVTASQVPDAQTAGADRTTQSPVGQALSGLPNATSGDASPIGLAPLASAVPRPNTPQANVAQATAKIENVLGPDSSVAPTPVAQSVSLLADADAAASTVNTGEVAAETPVLPQTGRARDAIAAKLAEMTDLGQAAGGAPKPVATQTFASGSESESQDAARDPFESAVRQPSSGANASAADHAPVFTVNAPAEALAATAVRETAQIQQPPADGTPDPENVGRLIHSMRVQLQAGVHEATVRLKPEHFGEVTISLRVERGAVSAVIHTDAPAVQQWLESQEDKLRSGLADQGLHLERFQVQRDRSQERRGDERRQQSPAPRYRQSRDTGVRFEVSV